VTCSICRELERDFEATRGEYLDALSAVFYRVSTHFAASKNVELERARNALEEHKAECVKVMNSAPLPVQNLLAFRS